MFPFDPTQMDPKVLMELSKLVQQLPPDQLNRMQGLMHNMMAGFDVKQEMEEFEKSLPPGFREKLAAIMAQNPVRPMSEADAESSALPANEREARLTILRAVRDGQMSPEDAEKLLFNG